VTKLSRRLIGLSLQATSYEPRQPTVDATLNHAGLRCGTITYPENVESQFLPLRQFSQKLNCPVRTHSEPRVAEIAGSIKAFGFTNPILIGEDCDIVAGHGRLAAARLLGLAEVPVIAPRSPPIAAPMRCGRRPPRPSRNTAP
jgi:ParB-like nuclease domain